MYYLLFLFEDEVDLSIISTIQKQHNHVVVMDIIEPL